MVVKNEEKKLAKAMASQSTETTFGSFFIPSSLDSAYQALGLTPDKLVIPRNYHTVVRMCYDFYQRGGVVAKVLDRLVEFAITDVHNGQRNTTDEQNIYYECILHHAPTRLFRFLHYMALEYLITGMTVPRVEWVPVKGVDLHPKLDPKKVYMMPKLDTYPPLLTTVEWNGWGSKSYWLKVDGSDIKNIRSKGGRIKEQQLKYRDWENAFPNFVQQIQKGADSIQLTDIDPIMRRELSITPYPTPYMFNILEPLVFKQQLRRMDFAVASRVINAILLITEGNDLYPLGDDSEGNLANLQNQVMARQGDPRKQERLFMLFSNHTTKMEWITPDVSALLNIDKYREVNEELQEGLGFPQILLTGQARATGNAGEVSTWAIQPQMEELRTMLLEWIVQNIYYKAAEYNKFRQMPDPEFKPLKLQDAIKTAAVFQQLFTEGNVSRTTRDEMAGIDFESETELMRDEAVFAEDLPAFTPMPYSPLPPTIGGAAGRPTGSQNVPVNNRNSGVKPKGQKPKSKVKAELANIDLLSDDKLVELFNVVAEERGIVISMNDIID